MMKGKVIFLALSAMALATSCSNDEVTEISNNNAIKFDVTAENASRAAESFCNNILPESFKVYADINNSLYINGDEIKKEGNSWVDQEGTRYWPDEALNFYAHVNGDFNWNNGTPQIKDFTVEDEVANQVDLITAVKKNQSKTASTTVKLNFRHALSQIVFRAKNTNKKLYVEISGVSVANIKNKGTYTFSSTDTDNNYVHHSNTKDENTTLNGLGSWELTDDVKSYSVKFDPITVENEYTPLTLPKDDHNKETKFTQAMMLIPQEITAWDAQSWGENVNGSYFLVKCKIYNIAGDEYNESEDTELYDGEIAIPVKSITWEQGKRYIYSFVFGKGNGGYTPGDDPKPVLVPIEYEVTVDDFIPVETEDIEMETQKDDASSNNENA